MRPLGELGHFQLGRYFGTRETRLESSDLTFLAKVINKSASKRILDALFAIILIIVLFPGLLVIALGIFIDSPGPVLFRQERYGKDKKVFRVFKFRTMRVAESAGPFIQAKRGDSRLTRLGWILRHTSLDELPQLLNVVKGDMSLVGPRPHAVPMDDLFGAILPGYSDRHLVRPGITGLAQVRGYRGPTETATAISVRLRHDRAYIQRWSIWLDLKILARTPAALIHKNAL